MVILHFVLVAVIIDRSIMVQVVGRIDIDPVPEHMSRWISGIDMGNKRLIGLRQ
ncbi:hypothetical protein D3C75_1336140 [compost metagenome]